MATLDFAGCSVYALLHKCNSSFKFIAVWGKDTLKTVTNFTEVGHWTIASQLQVC